MRIAIGQLWQETNTFNAWPTTRADFERFGVSRGDDLVARMAETNELGGFIQSFTASVLVAKSPCGFRAAYANHAREILVVRAPGCAPSDFWRYEYRQISRPLWPWDSLEEWTPCPQIMASWTPTP